MPFLIIFPPFLLLLLVKQYSSYKGRRRWEGQTSRKPPKVPISDMFLKNHTTTSLCVAASLSPRSIYTWSRGQGAKIALCRCQPWKCDHGKMLSVLGQLHGPWYEQPLNYIHVKLGVSFAGVNVFTIVILLKFESYKIILHKIPNECTWTSVITSHSNRVPQSTMRLGMLWV